MSNPSSPTKSSRPFALHEPIWVKNGRDLFGHDAIVLNPQLDQDGCIYVRYNTSAFKAWVPVGDIQRDSHMTKRKRRRPRTLYDGYVEQEEKKEKAARGEQEKERQKRKREEMSIGTTGGKKCKREYGFIQPSHKMSTMSTRRPLGRTLPMTYKKEEASSAVKQDISSSSEDSSNSDLDDDHTSSSPRSANDTHVKKQPSSSTTSTTQSSHRQFTQTLHRMLQDESKIISWTPQGDGIQIHNKHVFLRETLPNYFACQWSAFQAILYSYGFERKENGSFRHDKFRRGKPERYLEVGRNVGDTRKFPEILMEMVTKESNKVIGWTKNGDAFTIFDKDAFMNKVLPKYSYSKSYQYSSFQKQLLLYGFVSEKRKKGGVRYSHSKFLKHKQKACRSMKRKLKRLTDVQLKMLPFPQQLMELVNFEPRDVIGWSKEGDRILVHDSDRLLFEVLPKYDTMDDIKKFEELGSILKKRGFRRIREDVSGVDAVFKHELFHRDHPELCLQMEALLPPSRKKILSNASFPMVLMDVITDHPRVVEWNSEGGSFSIRNEKLFTNVVSSRCSDVSNWKALRQKLKMHGFTETKGGKKRKVYKHDLFKRDKPELCRSIKCTQKGTKRRSVHGHEEENETGDTNEDDGMAHSGDDNSSSASDSESVALLPPTIKSLNSRPNLWSLHENIDKFQSISKIKMVLPQEFHCRSPYIAEFFLFCHEWQLVWDRMRSGSEQESWSKEDFFSSTKIFMPSLYRELNKDSFYYHRYMIEIRSRVLKECGSNGNACSIYLQEALWASISFRLINRLETFEKIGGIRRKDEWNNLRSILYDTYPNQEDFDAQHKITFDSYIKVLTELQTKNRLVALSNNLAETAWSSHFKVCFKTVECFTSDLKAWEVISDLFECGALYMSGRDGHIGPEAKGTLTHIFGCTSQTRYTSLCDELKKIQKAVFRALGVDFVGCVGRDINFQGIERFLSLYHMYLRWEP